MTISPRALRAWFETGPMTCTTAEDAEAWFDHEVTLLVRAGMPEDEALSTVRTRLGLATGFYPIEVARRVYALWQTPHPVFGTPDERASFTPRELYELSLAMHRVSTGRVEGTA